MVAPAIACQKHTCHKMVGWSNHLTTATLAGLRGTARVLTQPPPSTS